MKTITIDGVEYSLVPVIQQPVQWEPKRVLPDKYYFYISSDGEILRIIDRKVVVDDSRLQLGNYFHSKDHAFESSTQLRKLLRLQAYVREFDPNYNPNWEDHTEHKYYVYFDGKKWESTFTLVSCSPTSVYMSKEIAKDLVIKLNSGEVIL